MPRRHERRREMRRAAAKQKRAYLSETEVPMERMLKCIAGLPSFTEEAILAFVGGQSSYDFLAFGKPGIFCPNLAVIGLTVFNDIGAQLGLRGITDDLTYQILWHAELIYDTVKKYGVSGRSALPVQRAIVMRPWTTRYRFRETMFAATIAGRGIGDDVRFFSEARGYDESAIVAAQRSLTDWFAKASRPDGEA